MNKNSDHLPDRWRRIVQRVITGEDWAAAARNEDCSPSYAKVIRGRIMKHPVAVKMLEAAEATLREKTLFTKEKAVREIDAQIKGALAAKNPNHMAAAQLLLLKCKIHGLVRDKIEVEHVDMRGALIEARTRVITLTDITPKPSAVLTDARVTVPGPAASLSADGSPRWQPFISGD